MQQEHNIGLKNKNNKKKKNTSAYRKHQNALTISLNFSLKEKKTLRQLDKKLSPYEMLESSIIIIMNNLHKDLWIETVFNSFPIV